MFRDKLIAKTDVLRQPDSRTARARPPSPSLSFLHWTKEKNDMATHQSEEFESKNFSEKILT